MRCVVKKLIFDTTEKQINNHIFLNIESILSCNKDIEEMLKDKSLQELKKINIDNGEIGYYYKLFLELLSKWLNNKHNEKHKKIYWETILTPWLYEFISRELYIYKGINIVLDDEQYISDYYEDNEYLTAENINDSFDKLCSDKNFNKITYSLQMKYFQNISFVKKELSYSFVQCNQRSYVGKIKSLLKHPEKILEYVGRNLSLIILKNSEKLLGCDDRIILRLPFPDSFHRRLNLLKLLFKSKFKIISYMDKNNKLISKYSAKDRNKLIMYLKENTDKDDRFCSILTELIPYALPKSYLEGYNNMVDFVSSFIKDRPRQIFGVSPFFTSDDFNMYTAYWREKGVKIIGAQHGLNYEFEQDIGRTEYILSDIFYTWGNLYENDNTKIKKFCAWDLEKNKNIFFAGQITGVEGYVESASSGLIAGINMARYLENKPLLQLDSTTAIGSLANYISFNHLIDRSNHFDPMNANFGIFTPLLEKVSKKERKKAYAQRAIKNIKKLIEEINN